MTDLLRDQWWEECNGHPDVSRIVSSHYFTLLSPHRSFPFRATERGMRALSADENPDECLAIYKGDKISEILMGLNGDLMGLNDARNRRTRIEAYNARSWRDLIQTVTKKKLEHLPALCRYQERGSLFPSVETALLISNAAFSFVKILASQYNQDGFVFAGPETDHVIKLFTVAERGISGLPNSYKVKESVIFSEDVKTAIKQIYGGVK